MATSIRRDNPIQQRWTRYRQRFVPKLSDSALCPPAPDLGLVVVIPCYSEPDVIRTIDTLHACARPLCAVEVLLIINAASDDDDAVHRQNEKTVIELAAWAQQHNEVGFRLHCVVDNHLPAKHQGVGLARKVGLDLAVSRFAEVAQENGVCVSLDADCIVDQQYLCAISDYFDKHPLCQIAVIDFEHCLDEVSDPAHRQAIAAYELHLRYYVQGLRYSGLPYDYLTLGSCFAVRVCAYMAQGGMNKRQAGEDFYFIHKFTALGQCGRILTTRVRPSARLSQRVPFGTGPTVLRWVESGLSAYTSYDPRVFSDLRCLVDWLNSLRNISDFGVVGLQVLPQTLNIFLQQQGVAQRMAEIRANTASIETLVARFLRWFNAFLVLKYIHFSHETRYQSKSLILSAQRMLQMSGHGQEADGDLFALLSLYRRYDGAKT